MSAKEPINLDQLADDFRIMGELAGRDDARVFLAKRLADDRAVLITAVKSPPGDKGNSLSHLAADTKLLATLSHPSLLPVLGGQWIGGDALAVVTERPNVPTLEELLTRRDEAFGFPRVAAILRQINGAIEWARGRKVVHRALRLDSIYVEPGSDQVRVMFAASALPADGVPGEQEDATSIARIARAILTRSPTAPERDRLPLGELRPGLPTRVVEQTEALLQGGENASHHPIAISEYIACIAMAEEMKHGEVECERVISEMSEEQRTTREKLAAERAAHEADLAEQARKFAGEKDATEKAFAKEKESAERALNREREQLHRAVEKERDELRRAMEKERDELRRAMEKERKRMEKERAALAKDRAAFERSSAKSREQLVARLADLESQARLYDHTAELPIADRELMAPVAREQDWRADDVDVAEPPETIPGFGEIDDTTGHVESYDAAEEASVPADPYDEIVDEPEPSYARPEDARTAAAGPWWKRAWESRSRRAMGIAAIALVGIATAASLAIGRSGSPRQTPRTAIVADSAAGMVEQPLLMQHGTPTTSVETTTASMGNRPVILPRVERGENPTAPEATARPQFDSTETGRPFATPIDLAPAPIAQPALPPIVPVDTMPRRDTMRLPETPRLNPIPLFPPASRDTTPRPFPLSLPRPDTIRPDSLSADVQR